MGQPGLEPNPQPPENIVSRVGVDWWATIVAGVITALAVANVLPKIPW